MTLRRRWPLGLLILALASVGCSEGRKNPPDAAARVLNVAPSYASLLYRREEITAINPPVALAYEASSGDLSLPLVIVCAILGAIAGDNISYGLGAWLGERRVKRLFGGAKSRRAFEWAKQSERLPAVGAVPGAVLAAGEAIDAATVVAP